MWFAAMTMISSMFATVMAAMAFLPSAHSFVLTAKYNYVMPRVLPWQLYASINEESVSLPLPSRYKKDIDDLNLLLDSQEVQKLEQIKHLILDIQQIQQNHEVSLLPRQVRDALTDYHNAKAKYGVDSREAKVAHAYFTDISNAKGLKPNRYLGDSSVAANALAEGLAAVKALEELQEIAHEEKCKYLH